METISKMFLLDPLLVTALFPVSKQQLFLISSCHLLHLPTRPGRENLQQAWPQSQEAGSLPGS